MDISEDAPFRDRLEKVKSTWPEIGNQIEDLFDRIDGEYLDYKVLEKRTKNAKLSLTDNETMLELQLEIDEYWNRLSETDKRESSIYAAIYFRYKNSEGKGVIYWEDVDKALNKVTFPT